MGLLKTVTKAAGAAAVKKINGGCPGSSDGKHKYRGEQMKDADTGKKTGVTVFYCKNPGCGRMKD